MKYNGKIRCPYCKVESNSFEYVREWTNNMFVVNEVKCSSCSELYRIYFGEKKDGTKIAYTIPKGNP